MRIYKSIKPLVLSISTGFDPAPRFEFLQLLYNGLEEVMGGSSPVFELASSLPTTLTLNSGSPKASSL